VVKVLAIMRTWPSSDSWLAGLSDSRSLESRIEWKIVGWERSFYFVFVPDVIDSICVSVSWELVNW
jgi:hypothetical protein